MIKVSSRINAILVLVTGFLLLRAGDQIIRSRIEQELHKRGIYPYLWDVGIGLFLITPVSAGITWILFRVSKEQKTLSNIISVFASVFGVLSALYFLYTLRY